ncbi:MAG: hypothetical protein OJJ54_14915 [Pseudonocardia sp.]|nr:hypothetical protein [Pseudonocardia sp.]
MRADQPEERLSLLAECLHAAVTDAARLSRAIGEASPDAVGRTWAERTDLVGRELHRQAELATELATTVRRLLTGEQDGPHGRWSPLLDLAGLPHPGAARLPGTDGRRTSDSRGVVLPLLPDGPP